MQDETKLLSISKFLWVQKRAFLCYNGQKEMELKIMNSFGARTLNEQSDLIHRAQTGVRTPGLIFSTTHSPFCEDEKVYLKALPFPHI